MVTTARATTNVGQTLRRYTDLTAAIDLLARKSLTLLDPATWDDRNDSYFLRYYKENSVNRSVLALCLSTVGETYHHWRVFCPHPSGVCIEFNRSRLLEALIEVPGFRHRHVEYMTLEKIAAAKQPLDLLPFIKRYAFRHEEEYRLIYETAEVKATHSLSIPIGAIEGITLSPWMPQPLLESVRHALQAIKGCDAIRVTRSELISNQLWQSNAARAIRGDPLTATVQQASEN
jgi:hypothetical protein